MKPSQLPEDVGSKLAMFRQGMRMKQSELARIVNLDASTISRYEGGESTPSLEDAQVLLNAIGSNDADAYATYLGQQWRCLPRPAFDHPQRSALWNAEQE